MSSNSSIRQRDGYQTKITFEDGKMFGQTIQHDRKQIMERNAELRKNAGAVRTWDFGKLELDIPHADFKILAKFYPGIDTPGHPDHKFQLRRFLMSPVSDPYRVNERKKGVNR